MADRPDDVTKEVSSSQGKQTREMGDAEPKVFGLSATSSSVSDNMAVLLNTSLGDMVVDLQTEKCPLTSKNFLKLCKIKYYNNCLFHSVQKDFLVQTGDPTGTGVGGDSIYKFLYGEQARFFNDEIHQNLKHDRVGVVAMASAGENLNASQFYITTRADLEYLDKKHTVFGLVAEGEEVLMKINEAFVDDKFRPYKNIRIKHTHVLDDPFEDPPQLAELIPENSPVLPPPAKGEEVRLEDDWVPMDQQMEPEELDNSLRRKEAHSRAVVLEMIGDIPDAEIKPPENVLFVCKLNPVTQDEDLETIFSRFGKIISADIIRDYKTGDSLCYAFIEFDSQEACEAAYFKMDNVLIDDRRIHVDFSQSVSRLWTRYRRFGKRDIEDGRGSSFAPKSSGTGCFKCGVSGHFAKDCPGEKDEDGGPQERPKYEVKSNEGQCGGAAKRYDMVFEDTSEAEEEQARRAHKISKDEWRNRLNESHAARREKDDSYGNRSYHQSKESKRYTKLDDSNQHRSKDSKKYSKAEERVGRHSSGFDSRHTESKDTISSDRIRSHRDRKETGSDRHSGRRDSAGEDYHRGHRDRPDTDSERCTRQKDGSPEECHELRPHVSTNSRKRDGESLQEDRYSHSRNDRYDRYDSPGSRKRHREGSPRKSHFEDAEKSHDRRRR
ncbi:hypothetical protein L7F22_008643 [Adiantum nelumboides]|nr:hypothetical protein [Adiantum nelumboides]